jgi:hypothetical protein
VTDEAGDIVGSTTPLYYMSRVSEFIFTAPMRRESFAQSTTPRYVVAETLLDLTAADETSLDETCQVTHWRDPKAIFIDDYSF